RHRIRIPHNNWDRKLPSLVSTANLPSTDVSCSVLKTAPLSFPIAHLCTQTVRLRLLLVLKHLRVVQHTKARQRARALCSIARPCFKIPFNSSKYCFPKRNPRKFPPQS